MIPFPRNPAPHNRPLPFWTCVAPQLSSDRDCLASFIALEAAEVLGGAKPGNLVKFANRTKPCGRNPFEMWQSFGQELLADSSLSAMVMLEMESALLVYLYEPGKLRQYLTAPNHRDFLDRIGYPPGEDCEEALTVLAGRMDRDRFPHEVGLFLGYPLKDVKGFMGLSPTPFSCQGPWKIYGDPRPSLALVERHRACRQRMGELLAESRYAPQELLQAI